MSDRPQTQGSQWGFATTSVVLGLGLAAGICEAMARMQALPRVQHVDLGATGGTLVDGVPVWGRSARSDDRRGEPCEGRPEVLLLGSSIFYGSGVDTPDALTPALQARLPDWCVRNLAQPAYTYSNQAAELTQHLATEDPPPRVVVWEIWANSPNDWLVLGDQAYNFSSLAGVPPTLPNPLRLSEGLHQQLFSWLATYRHVVVRRAEKSSSPTYPERLARLGHERLSPTVDALSAKGARVVLALMPGLDAPFATTARDPGFRYEALLQTVEGRVSLVPVAERFEQRELDHLKVRVDPCCHYNPDGLDALAEVLAEAIDKPGPDSRSPDPPAQPAEGSDGSDGP